jgi:hypothetical protein
MPRLLDVNNFPVFEKPDLDVFCTDVGSSQFHVMLRRMQRDHGMISDGEMAVAERAMAGALVCVQQRVMFNPFTGEFRREGLNL